MAKNGLNIPSKKYLTKTEKIILHLITEEFLTPKQITLRRNTSIQAFYKIRRKLINKGALTIANSQTTPQPLNLNYLIRLHGEEINIKIVYQDHRYQNKLKKCNTLFIDSNTIRLYQNSIEIYSGQSFFGNTKTEANSKSMDYWRTFITKLEYNLKVILVKERKNNIRFVNAHYARTNSKLCENAIDEGKVRVFAEEDGKLAFLTDDSHQMKEDECVHPLTANEDRDRIDKHINDIRLRNPPTNSELTTVLMRLGESQLRTQDQMTELVKRLNDMQKM